MRKQFKAEEYCIVHPSSWGDIVLHINTFIYKQQSLTRKRAKLQKQSKRNIY